jgi:hypothetical protein
LGEVLRLENGLEDTRGDGHDLRRLNGKDAFLFLLDAGFEAAG